MRAQVLLLVAVLALPFALVQVYLGYKELRHITTVAEITVLGQAGEVAASMRQFLALGRRATGALAVEPGMALLDKAVCQANLPTAHRGLPQFVNLLVFDAEGTLVCGSRDGAISIADRPYFAEVQRTRAFTVSPPLIGRIVDTWVVGLTSPILGPEGEFRGVVVASVELERFQELLDGISVPSGNIISVGTSDGIVLARSRDAERWVGQPLPAGDVDVTDLEGDRHITRAIDLAGVRRIWGRVDLEETGWRAFVGVPEAEVRRPQLAHFYQQAAAGLMALALAMTAAFLVQRGITRSLAGLTRSVRAAADGRAVSIPVRAPIEVAEVVHQLERTLSERDRAREVARKATHRFRDIVENAVYGIFLSTMDGRFMEVNRALVEMLGYDDAEELKGVHVASLYLDPRQRVVPTDGAAGDRLLADREVDWRRKDGQPIRVRLNGKIVRGSGDETAMEVMVEDVTRQRALEEMTRHQQKMEAVGRLAGGVAHEFNNLLTVLSVNADLIRGGLGPDSPMREEVDEIASAVDRANSVTRRLLAFSRRDVTQPRVHDVNRVIEGLQGMLPRVLGDDVILHIEFGEDAGSVLIDGGQLEQVILNLVINARDALRAGGDVTISTSRRLTAADDDVGTTEWSVIVVRDNGEGMDADMQKLIFEPFFTTKPPGSGTGLGLPTVYGIVTEAGGRVEVESTAGVGSTFEIWLPTSSEAPDDTA